MPFGLIPSIIGLGGSIFGGLMGKHAADTAGKTQSDAAKQLLELINQKVPEANAIVGKGTTDANDILQKFYEQNIGLLQPYLEGGKQAEGQLAAGLAPGGQFNKPVSAGDILAQDPGYAFRLQQGQLALDRSASAKGGFGGGADKAAVQFGQDYGSAEYNNSFNRYNTTQGNLYSRLAALANGGLSATGTGVGVGAATGAGESQNIMTGAGEQSRNLLDALGIQGNAITGAANANAAATVGGTNALTEGITQGLNGLTQAQLLKQLLGKQQTAPSTDSGYQTIH